MEAQKQHWPKPEQHWFATTSEYMVALQEWNEAQKVQPKPQSKHCFAACPHHVIQTGQCSCYNELYNDMMQTPEQLVYTTGHHNIEVNRTTQNINYHRRLNGMQDLPDFTSDHVQP